MIDVPLQWQELGFSGEFHINARLNPDDPDRYRFITELPTRIPFGTNSSWLALSFDQGTNLITLVRQDAAAIIDLFRYRPSPN